MNKDELKENDVVVIALITKPYFMNEPSFEYELGVVTRIFDSFISVISKKEFDAINRLSIKAPTYNEMIIDRTTGIIEFTDFKSKNYNTSLIKSPLVIIPLRNDNKPVSINEFNRTSVSNALDKIIEDINNADTKRSKFKNVITKEINKNWGIISVSLFSLLVGMQIGLLLFSILSDK